MKIELSAEEIKEAIINYVDNSLSVRNPEINLDSAFVTFTTGVENNPKRILLSGIEIEGIEVKTILVG